uniref:Putative ovule protein n=1 Tax=Solanum chacoense TaxID=4108 RepID=A0A0V0GV10_SOLCH
MKNNPSFKSPRNCWKLVFYVREKKVQNLLVLLLWNEEMLRDHLYLLYTCTKRNRVNPTAKDFHATKNWHQNIYWILHF